MQKVSPIRRIEPAVNNIFRLLHHQMRFQINGEIDFFQIGWFAPSSRRREPAVHHVNLRPRNQPLHLGELCFQLLKIFGDNGGNNHRGDISQFFLDFSSAQDSSVSFSNSDKSPSSAFSNCSSSPSSSIFISTLSVPAFASFGHSVLSGAAPNAYSTVSRGPCHSGAPALFLGEAISNFTAPAPASMSRASGQPFCSSNKPTSCPSL